MRADILIRRIPEELLMDETADHGVGRLERRRERREDVMPVDIEPRLGREAVSKDPCRERLRWAAKKGCQECGLHLTQWRHEASLRAPCAGVRRRRTTRRGERAALGCQCPIP